MLSVVLSIVKAPDGKRVIKHRCSHFKAHSVIFEIGTSLSVVPFKFQFIILRETRSSPGPLGPYPRARFSAGFKFIVRISLCK